MRIVYFNHNVVGTGTFLRAYRLACEVARAGHDVTVVTTSANTRYGVTRRAQNGVTVIEAPDLMWGWARTGWDPYNTLVRCMASVTGSVDLIHAFDSRPAVIVPALYLRRRTGARLVIDWADWWGRGGTILERTPGAGRYLIEPVETWFEERFRTQADLTTTICRPLLERVVSLGVARESAHVVPNGCIPLPRVPRAEARQQLGVPPAAPLLLHLGASFRRDLSLTLSAFAKVREQVPDARLVFAGRLPIQIGKQDGVSTLGRVSEGDVVRWLAAADICLLPLSDTVANRGRWPSKVNEYLAAGRAVAMTAVGDVADWVGSHECGAVSAAEPAAFGDAIVDLLGNDDRRRAAEINALAVAEGPLAWPSIAQHVHMLYQKIAAPAIGLNV